MSIIIIPMLRSRDERKARKKVEEPEELFKQEKKPTTGM